MILALQLYPRGHFNLLPTFSVIHLASTANIIKFVKASRFTDDLHEASSGKVGTKCNSSRTRNGRDGCMGTSFGARDRPGSFGYSLDRNLTCQIQRRQWG